jgi:mono/diheme cytochrome c family protein
MRLVWSAIAVAAAIAVTLITAHVAFRSDPQIARGHALYTQHCASCHGAQLEGQPDWQTPRPDGRMPAPPHDVAGHTWHHSDEQLFQMTKHGMSAIVPGYVSDMPAFAGTLTDAEIVAILAYIKSRWPRREREYQAMRSRTR